jgi:hypothetical protein
VFVNRRPHERAGRMEAAMREFLVSAWLSPEATYLHELMGHNPQRGTLLAVTATAGKMVVVVAPPANAALLVARIMMPE